MSFQKIKVEGVPLTPELAHKFATLPPLPGERDVKPSRREYLLQAVRDGFFGGPDWAQGVDRSTGSIYRLDGQHSSKLLASLPIGVDFPSGLLVTIDTWEFDSVERDGAAIFNLFNHPRSARTNEDAMGIYRARVVELNEIPKRLLQKIGDGIAEYNKGLKPEPGLIYGPRDRGMYFAAGDHKYADFACWAMLFSDTKNASFMGRSAIVAEMLQDWIAHPHRATEFWDYVLRESHPEPDHETRTLAETFKSWATQKKQKASDYRRKANTAWRHYLKESRSAAAETPLIDMSPMVFSDASVDHQNHA